MTKKMEVKFDGRPIVGTALSDKEQRFVIAAVRDYERKDGSPSWIITWETKCAACGVPVRFETGNGFTPKRRNCDEHKMRIG